jgi:hypothetical protein
MFGLENKRASSHQEEEKEENRREIFGEIEKIK